MPKLIAMLDTLRAAGWKSHDAVALLQEPLRRALPTLRASAEAGNETDAALVPVITTMLGERP